MTWDVMEGRWYQFVGRMRAKLGYLAKNELEASCGERDQLVGRIKEHCGVPTEEAIRLADEFFLWRLRQSEEPEVPVDYVEEAHSHQSDRG